MWHVLHDNLLTVRLPDNTRVVTICKGLRQRDEKDEVCRGTELTL